jgi:hypothetical protein
VKSATTTPTASAAKPKACNVRNELMRAKWANVAAQ